MTRLPFSQEQIDLMKRYVLVYKLSDVGCNIPNYPLLEVDKFDFTLLAELMDLINVYFRFSGQKGLGVEEVRGGILKPLCSSYINRGLVYLAFLLNKFVLQKEKAQNPRIRCRYVNLKDYTERHQHSEQLRKFIRDYKEKSAATNEESPS